MDWVLDQWFVCQSHATDLSLLDVLVGRASNRFNVDRFHCQCHVCLCVGGDKYTCTYFLVFRCLQGFESPLTSESDIFRLSVSNTSFITCVHVHSTCIMKSKCVGMPEETLYNYSICTLKFIRPVLSNISSLSGSDPKLIISTSGPDLKCWTLARSTTSKSLPSHGRSVTWLYQK